MEIIMALSLVCFLFAIYWIFDVVFEIKFARMLDDHWHTHGRGKARRLNLGSGSFVQKSDGRWVLINN